MNKTTIVLGILAVILFNCQDKVLKSDLVLNDTVTIALGETKYNYEKGLKIKFDSVVYDNRCPLGVVCVLEGFAILRFKLTDNNELTTFELFTPNIVDSNFTKTKKYQIELISVDNFPANTGKPKKYRSKIKIRALI